MSQDFLLVQTIEFFHLSFLEVIQVRVNQDYFAVTSLQSAKRGPTYLALTGEDSDLRACWVLALWSQFLYPLEGQGGRHLGAVAIFWNADEP